MPFSEHIKASYTPKRLAVRLHPKGERFVLQKHPWVFSKHILKISDSPHTGDLVIIFNKNRKLLGLGLYDADSPIRIKMLHVGYKPKVIDAHFFENKIIIAHKKRSKLRETNTTSYRLLFGENDGFPGIIADVYATVLVVKLYSEIWLPYLENIVPILKTISETDTGVIRLSRLLKQSKTCTIKDGLVVYGRLNDSVVTFVEHGVRFSADVIRGHKTGYFLDHRANRKQVGIWSRHKTVLDVFAYAGGFSVHALVNGAKTVTSVDISKQALQIAAQNVKLNTYSGVHKTLAGDAFLILKDMIKKVETFDVVVIDPPSFAKQASEVVLAKKKYAQLAALGAQLVGKRGLLVLASCSSRVVESVFFETVAQALKNSRRVFKTILKTSHDSDHPIEFPEGAYLKCGYYRFLD